MKVKDTKFVTKYISETIVYYTSDVHQSNNPDNLRKTHYILQSRIFKQRTKQATFLKQMLKVNLLLLTVLYTWLSLRERERER